MPLITLVSPLHVHVLVRTADNQWAQFEEFPQFLAESTRGEE